MKKYKVFLTMEFEADVEAESEDEARDILANRITYGGGLKSWGCVKNAIVKRYWGGGHVMKGCDHDAE